MKKILIWGTGKIAAEVCNNEVNGNIVGFLETKKHAKEFRNKPVYSMDDQWPEFDYVIVANVYSDQIYNECIQRNFDLKKFIFLCPITKKAGVTDIHILREILKEKNYTKYCDQYKLYKDSFFKEDLREYESKNIRENFRVDGDNLWPIISDKYRKAGIVGNYFWQDLWAAKLIKRSGVEKHFDIGSRIDGFIAHLLVMGLDVTLIDIRDFPGEVEGLHTIVDDATTLRQVAVESIESMSALCSLEHFGLGRYGDPIDPEACFKCFEEIQKRIKKGGNLYLSLPIGKERIEFNAHRIFYASTIAECFNTMELAEFSCTAGGKIEYNIDIYKYDNDGHNGEYRYGLFHFIKK